MDDLERLTAMRKLLTPLGAWIQGNYTLLPFDAPDTKYDLQRGTCFCLVGAYYKVDGSQRAGDHAPVEALLGGCLPDWYDDKDTSDKNVSGWNDEDGRTQAEVLAVLDCAIAARSK